MNDAARAWILAYGNDVCRRNREVERRCDRLRRFNADMLDIAHAIIAALVGLIVTLVAAAGFFLALGRWG